MATGYADKLPMKAWTWSDESVITGAGGLVSNAEDMMKYVVAQLNSTQSLSKIFSITHQSQADAGKMKIGYGWHIRDEDVIWHNGGTGGFRSFTGFNKKTSTGVVILTNSTTGADDLGFHLLNNKYELKALRKAIAVDNSVLKQYMGTYEISPAFKISVLLEGNNLLIQATGQPKINIYAETESKFYLKVVDARIEFERNTSGEVDRLVLFQNGAVMTGKKITN
jgi:hypothetical protein